MTISSFSRAQLASLTPSLMLHRYHLGRRSFSARCVPPQPPDLPHLAETARISLTPKEVEEFAPKIRQGIDWFGQLQAVNLESIEPALGPDTGVGDNFREDVPEIFEQREAMLGGVPSYDEPYIKVPKVLNKM